MREDPKQEVALIRNLHDAGCTRAVIDPFLSSHPVNAATEQPDIPTGQRTRLLDTLYRKQSKLDCLD